MVNVNMYIMPCMDPLGIGNVDILLWYFQTSSTSWIWQMLQLLSIGWTPPGIKQISLDLEGIIYLKSNWFQEQTKETKTTPWRNLAAKALLTVPAICRLQCPCNLSRIDGQSAHLYHLGLIHDLYFPCHGGKRSNNVCLISNPTKIIKLQMINYIKAIPWVFA